MSRTDADTQQRSAAARTLTSDVGSRVAFALVQLLRFGWVQAQCCLFAVAVFVGLAAISAVPLPLPRYDVLLAYALVLTAVFFLLRLETGREVAVIFAFHLIAWVWRYSRCGWARGPI